MNSGLSFICRYPLSARPALPVLYMFSDRRAIPRLRKRTLSILSCSRVNRFLIPCYFPISTTNYFFFFLTLLNLPILLGILFSLYFYRCFFFFFFSCFLHFCLPYVHLVVRAGIK